MRVVIQRVSKASVEVNHQVVGKIGPGLLVLAGFESQDNHADICWMSSKISRLRIFDDRHGIMNCSVQEIHGEILVVSQFTLYAATKKGNRPSYIRAAHPDLAVPLYESFLKQLESDSHRPVQTGVFGAMMEVSLINDGPVTIVIDSRNKE
ncbi:MAG: D-aminoacyl-tRNA deacylase [Bacteroidales bacterium]|nr:D-aminoacyl-tRNA deacylase [Bacteroidales bacterium]MDD2323127.1 D-aminoacyl-tRNA deacylase [Bacteroidales bacterium]MDD3960351.1 D-aminoacyl-tRNA deacylase [Bacteroidales bacterium]MDY0284961.1 D-aminoacyl-tRNA deacylase [Bacteroidales bacterium]HPE86611.1 D-aminoacyl-tRNA deacylase [Bacteroidales bacterium]